MTLFDTVLYCIRYQVLSCNNFIVSVIETNGQYERVISGWFSRERERSFSQKQGRQ